MQKANGSCKEVAATKSMFFSNPEMDLNFLIFFSLLALVISVAVCIFTEKKLLSVITLSVLLNFVFYGNTDYRFLAFYDILWLFKFILYYWPIINILLISVLIIGYIRNKSAKNKQK